MKTKIYQTIKNLIILLSSSSPLIRCNKFLGCYIPQLLILILTLALTLIALSIASFLIYLSNIKYNHLRIQNNNFFYSFHDQLNYGLAKYFAQSETTKINVDKFLSEPLMVLLTEKLFY